MEWKEYYDLKAKHLAATTYKRVRETLTELAQTVNDRDKAFDLYAARDCVWDLEEQENLKEFTTHVADCGCEGCALDSDIIEEFEEIKETDPIKELAFKLNAMSETQAISYLDVISGKKFILTNLNYVGKDTLTEVMESDNASKYTREIIRKFLEKWE